jgi:glucokinase
MPDRPLVAGVDVGGTKVAVLVVPPDGSVAGRTVLPMDREAGVARIVEAVRQALTAAGAAERDLAAIGVGAPGWVDAEAGVVRLATNLGWRDLALAAALEEALGVPCGLENDVGLAAMGLVDHPLSRGARSLAYVAVGTGIGAGIVVEGERYRGRRGGAGEIGHVVAIPDGARCACGQRGCLETVAAGWGIERAARDAVASGSGGRLRELASITAADVYAAARDGDATALEITRAAGAALARAIVGLVLITDLERVLIGGGVAAAGDAFLDPLRTELDRLRADSDLVRGLLADDAVVVLPPDFEAVAWGGVALARRIGSEKA